MNADHTSTIDRLRKLLCISTLLLWPVFVYWVGLWRACDYWVEPAHRVVVVASAVVYLSVGKVLKCFNMVLFTIIGIGFIGGLNPFRLPWQLLVLRLF